MALVGPRFQKICRGRGTRALLRPLPWLVMAREEKADEARD